MTGWIGKFFRFGITGAVGMCIDFAVTYACKEKLKWNKFYANATGFILAVTNNYIMNRVWTFHNNNPHIAQQFFLFLFISLTGLAFNTAIIYFLNEKKKNNFYMAKIVATLAVMCWNFGANSFLTFRYG